jgi:hypothetical protein
MLSMKKGSRRHKRLFGVLDNRNRQNTPVPDHRGSSDTLNRLIEDIKTGWLKPKETHQSK